MKVRIKIILLVMLISACICCLILIHEKLKIKEKYVIKSTPITLPLIKPPAEIIIHITEEDLINCVPLNLPFVEPRIEINKRKRKLFLYSDGKIVRIYKVALGFNPIDDKGRQGDGCTPEGEFYICQKNTQSEYYLSLGFSYPNAEDAERGLREGIITQEQYEQIIHAVLSQEVPPWDTPLGGALFIHGCGAQWDWTLGCIALNNDNIKELFAAVPYGTPLCIYSETQSDRRRL
jgi:L,D-peptidoglycan transpeptidase YkuD (ErfK/YbiS/YcfS/YnhG family)